jgi:sigma-E factor negative regulatory protein RseC
VIEEHALILSCEGEYATIETKPQGACGSCSSSGVCGTSVFAKAFGNRRTEMRVLNSIQAKPGDQVIIGLQDSALTKVSLVFYMVPILSMLLFAILGQNMATVFGYAAHDSFAIIGGVSGLVVGLVLVRIFANRVQQDSRYQPVMLRFAASDKVKFDINPHLPA